MEEAKITDKRMDELIERAKAAASRTEGGGDGSSLSYFFDSEVFRITLEHLIMNEQRGLNL